MALRRYLFLLSLVLFSCSGGDNPWRAHTKMLAQDICQKRVLCHQNEIQKTREFLSDKIKNQAVVALPDHYLRRSSCEKFLREIFYKQKRFQSWDEEKIEQAISRCRGDYRKQNCRDIVMSKTMPPSCRKLMGANPNQE